MARKIRIDMTGLRFGRLVGNGYSHRHANGHAYWLFACDCGNEIVTSGSAVRAGHATSCGCLHREICAARLLKHGRRAAKRHDATYRAWQAMNDACGNPESPKYETCGAYGIAVSSSWRGDFEAFLDAMGERPAGTILDRIDMALDFGPGNCRWVAAASRSDRARQGWKRRAMVEARSASVKSNAAVLHAATR